MNKNKTRKAKKKRKPTDDKIRQKRQMRSFRAFMQNIGFTRIESLESYKTNFLDMETDIDDMFVFENLYLMTEYTVIQDVSPHFAKKLGFYQKMLPQKTNFLQKLTENQEFATYYSKNLNEYGKSSPILAVIYVTEYDASPTTHSKNDGLVTILEKHKFDYFIKMGSAIKRSFLHEFFTYLKIDISRIGNSYYDSSKQANRVFNAVALKDIFGYLPDDVRIAAFYASPGTLLKSASVLRYNGEPGKYLYQRLIDKKKIQNMRKFISNDGFFPNNIIISTKNNIGVKIEESVKENAEAISLTFVESPNSLSIIDGQHRLYAYHNGDDEFEELICKRREQQVLLVVAIVFPQTISDEEKIKYEARVFLEINSTQKKVDDYLIQCIKILSDRNSSTAIAHYLLDEFNRTCLKGLIASVPEDRVGKLPRVSIVKYALDSLVARKSKDSISLFKTYLSTLDIDLATANTSHDNIDIDNYKSYCVGIISRFFDVFANEVKSSNFNWAVDRKDPQAILNVTTVNSILHCIKNFILNDTPIPTKEKLEKAFHGIFDKLNLKDYKSSQYARLGKEIYDFLVSKL